jgi:NhaP-type Na+/H+ or K+/H+ antiporter
VIIMAFGIGGGIIGIIALICAVWVIYDVWTNNKKLSDTAKIVWTVLAVIFSILTAIIYWLVSRK